MLETFSRRARSNNVVRGVREHYVRDDIHCGRQGCSGCSAKRLSPSASLEEAPILSNAAGQPSRGNRPLAVLDTNIILHHMDLVEHSAFSGVIVLGTVLEEVKHRSMPAYRRLRAVCDADSPSGRDFFIFVNQHARETFLMQREGESPNDYFDRCIRAAAGWYDSHVRAFPGSENYQGAVLVSEDADNRKLAAASGLDSLSVKEFVENFLAEEHPQLRDVVARVDTTSADPNIADGAVFPDHMSPDEVESAMRAGRLFQGPIHMNQRHCFEGYVPCAGLDVPPNVPSEIVIHGTVNLNRAVNGDIVAVELFPQDQWGVVEERFIVGKADEEANVENQQEKIPPSSASARPSGRVVAVIKRNWKSYPGSIEKPSAALGPQGGGQNVLFVPVDRSLPKIRLHTRQASSLADQRIIVCIDGWDKTSRYPHGHFVRSLGARGDKDVETEVLLLQHDIPFHDFPDSVMACLPARDWTVSTHATAKDWAQRRDLRDRCVCSVDPPGCTDIDDALHVKELDGPDSGLVEVGVHIADVSHFIRAGTALDAEAADRCTTVYLVNRRIDMVPKLLGENVCSLVGGGERFAFSVLWVMDPLTAEVKRVDYCKSVIRSRGALSYGEAQIRIDDKSQQDEITNSLRTLLSLSKMLKQNRINAGALSLASSEVRFIHEGNNRDHDPVELELYQTKDTNSMVEEFMLLANVWVGTKIVETFPNCAILRRHPPPEPAMFEPLLDSLRHRGLSLDTSTSKALAESLDEAAASGTPEFGTLLRMMTTRCMQQAVYFSSGTQSRDQYRHYGLAADIYTHFTSPIRRYADVIVHRLLAAAVGADTASPETLQSDYTQNIANQINKRHRMAQYAARVSTALHTWLYFRGVLERAQKRPHQWKLHASCKEGEVTEAAAVCDGFITKIRANGFVATVPKYGVEGIVFLAEAGEPIPTGWLYDERAQSLTQPTGQVLRAFDRVEVAIIPDDDNLTVRLLSLDPPLHNVRTPIAISAGTTEKRTAPISGKTAGGKQKRRRKAKT